MKTTRVSRNLTLLTMAVVCCLGLSGCEGDYAVPITSAPTEKVNQRLLGNWVSKHGTAKLRVRRLDDSIYILSVDGDLYQAFHSDVDKTPFISAQEIDSADRKYSYVTYRLSEDGQRLYVRVVNNKVIPKTTKTSGAVQKLLKANLRNSELFDEETEFVREK